MDDHKWIIGVCQDLREYAKKYDLEHVNSAVTHALNVALWEIGGTEQLKRMAKYEPAVCSNLSSHTKNERTCSKVVIDRYEFIHRCQRV